MNDVQRVTPSLPRCPKREVHAHASVQTLSASATPATEFSPATIALFDVTLDRKALQVSWTTSQHTGHGR